MHVWACVRVCIHIHIQYFTGYILLVREGSRQVVMAEHMTLDTGQWLRAVYLSHIFTAWKRKTQYVMKSCIGPASRAE